jgi:hypothetical protein
MLAREKRRSRRIDLNRAGEISSLTGQSVVGCLVLDISASGARLMVATPDVVPDYFRLNYGSESVKPKCRVRWRNDNEIGVEFFR